MRSNHDRSPDRPSGLRTEYLSYLEVLAQSIAAIAPSGMPVSVLPLVFASAGNATWLAYGLALLSIGFVCVTLNQFTRRIAASGSLYGYVALGLGQTAGFLTAWSLTLCYGLGVILPAAAFANYGNVLLSAIGWQCPPLLLYVVCILLAAYIAYRDIKLSSVFLLRSEAVSIGLMLWVAVAVLIHHRFAIDLPQLTLQGTSGSSFTFGWVIAVLSFIGFESAATLGDEAKHPHTTIPRAILGSTVMSGIFFIVMAYVVVLGFRDFSTPLNLSDAPLNVVAESAGIGVVGQAITIGVIISGFAGTLANLNAAARIVFALAQQGIFTRWLGIAHYRNQTPHRAIVTIALIAGLSVAPLFAMGVRPLDILGYSGVLLTDGFIGVYGLLGIAALRYLTRLNQLRWQNGVSAAIAVLVMGIAIVNSVYPVPPFPYNLAPYLFLLWLVLGMIWFFHLRRNKQITLVPKQLNS